MLLLLQSSTASQLENMIKDGVLHSQENNLEWLRKQHQMRKQTSSSPSSPHLSTSSSPEFQSQGVEGWQVSKTHVPFPLLHRICMKVCILCMIQ